MRLALQIGREVSRHAELARDVCSAQAVQAWASALCDVVQAVDVDLNVGQAAWPSSSNDC